MADTQHEWKMVHVVMGVDMYQCVHCGARRSIVRGQGELPQGPCPVFDAKEKTP